MVRESKIVTYFRVNVKNVSKFSVVLLKTFVKNNIVLFPVNAVLNEEYHVEEHGCQTQAQLGDVTVYDGPVIWWNDAFTG